MTSWVGGDKIVVETRGKAKRSDIYIGDLKDNKVIKLNGGFLWNHPTFNGLIGVGSLIYAIGDPNDYYNREYPEKPDDDDDDYHFHSGASFLDLEDPIGSWKGIDGMLNCYRTYPSCTFLGDNIFVFGAKSVSSPLYFGEFYDKKKNGRWQPIPMSGIDHKMKLGCPVISDPKRNRILVYFSFLTSLYAYYPDNNHEWVWIDDHKLSFRGREPAPSVVDDVLYFINTNYDYIDNCITAYDILTNKSLEVSWSSCSSPFGPDILDEIDFTKILYLGSNILCLTTTLITSNCVPFWEYYRFQVDRLSQQKVLLTPLSVHHLPAQGFNSQLNAIALL